MIIFLVALVIRALFVHQWLQLPYGQVPFLDANSYDQWAQSIAEGNWLRHTAFYQNPLYPYLVAMLYKAFGHSLILVGYFQAVLGALTCVLIAETTEFHFGKRAGLIAGLLMAFDRVLVFYSAPLVKETLGVFLLAAFMYVITTGKERWRTSFVSGLLLGAAVLVRSNFLLLPIGILLWDALCRPRILWRNYAWLVLGIAVVILPVTLHNWKVSDDFILVNYGGGFNFFIGNSDSATRSEYPAGVSTDPLAEEQDITRIAEHDLSRILKPSEVSDYWFHKGIQFLKDNPLAFPVLEFNKIWFFWMNYEIADNYDSKFVTANFSTILSFTFISFSILAILAAMGAAFGWRGNRSRATRGFVVMTVLYMLSVVLFYVTDRYRLPVLVFVIPLAAEGLQMLLEQIRNKDWLRVTKATLAACPFLVIGYYPQQINSSTDAFNWGTYASLSSASGHDEEAISAIQKAISKNPQRVNSSAYIDASTSYERLGRLKEAEDLLRQTTSFFPEEGMTWYNYARFKYEHGDETSAIELYDRALQVSPWLYQPYIGLGVLYIKQGRRAEAMDAVKKGLELKPGNSQLLQLLKMLGG